MGITRLVAVLAAATVGLSDARGEKFVLNQLPQDNGAWVNVRDSVIPAIKQYAADDVNFPGGACAWGVTRLWAILAANVDPLFAEFRIDVYPTDPAGSLPSTTLAPWRLITTAGASIGMVTVDGRSQLVYELDVGNGTTPLLITGAGSRLWVGPAVRSTFSVNERAFAGSFNFGLTPGGIGAVVAPNATGPWTAASVAIPGFADLAIRVEAEPVCALPTSFLSPWPMNAGLNYFSTLFAPSNPLGPVVCGQQPAPQRSMWLSLTPATSGLYELLVTSSVAAEAIVYVGGTPASPGTPVGCTGDATGLPVTPAPYPVFTRTNLMLSSGVPYKVQIGAGPNDAILGTIRLQPATGDFNNNGSKTVQDLFDFFGVWFAKLSAADINASGAVTVQDVFDFLGLWFG